MHAPNGYYSLPQAIRKRIVAFLLGQVDDTRQELYDAHKRELFQNLSGETILELGPGTGLNLHYVPQDAQWIGVEPNRYLHAHIRKKAHRLGRSIQLCTADAEMLPEYDNSIDAVISTLMLCSVENVDRVLHEIHRVLKPGGTYYFIEHVAADPEDDVYLWQAQILFQHLWAVCLDGCQLRCCPHEAIERTGFSEVTYEQVRIGSPYRMIRPHVIGHAVKPEKTPEPRSKAAAYR